MLILDSTKVVTGKVKTKKNPDGCAGVMYRNLLFVKGRTFANEERQEAIHICQEALDNGQFCILLKEKAGKQYTLCHQVKSASANGKTQAAAPKAATKRPSPPPPSRKPVMPNRDDGRTILQRPVT